jgi:hypothetical protein
VGGLNYVLVDCGELFVMITGVTVMPQLHATSWGFQETVSLLLHCISLIITGKPMTTPAKMS